jgi:hypothetical protein
MTTRLTAAPGRIMARDEDCYFHNKECLAWYAGRSAGSFEDTKSRPDKPPYSTDPASIEQYIAEYRALEAWALKTKASEALA